MQPSRPLQGVIPVVQTPLNEEASVDREGLTRLVEFLIDSGVGGFWALGTNSEDMNLTFAKRLEVAETITKANRGRLPLILGAGFYCYEDTLCFMDATKHLEFDAWHVMPYHPLLGLEGMEAFYRNVAAAAQMLGKPLWMYTSQNWCRSFPVSFYAKLKDCPNIAGVKFSNTKTTDLLAVAQLADENFQVITAVAKQFVVALDMGLKACTSSLAGCLPEPLVEIFEYHRHCVMPQEALKLQHRLNAFLVKWPKRPHDWNFLPAAEEKYILSLRGICKPYVTSYYTELTEEEQAQMRAALKEFGYLPDTRIAA